MNGDQARFVSALLGGFHDEAKRLEAQPWRIVDFLLGDVIRFSVGSRVAELRIVDENEIADEMAVDAAEFLDIEERRHGYERN